MKSNLKKLFCLVLLSTTFSIHGFSQLERDRSGNPIMSEGYFNSVIAPMALEKIGGGTVKPSDFKGKILIIDFWQTWCGPCLVGFKGFQKAKKEWPDKIEIIAASPNWTDTEAQINKFIKKNNYAFQFVWAKELDQDLALKSIPYKIIIGPEGQLLDSKSGTGGEVAEYEYLKELVKKYF